MALDRGTPAAKASMSHLSALVPRPVVRALRSRHWAAAELVAVKTLHSLIFFTEELSVGHLLYTGMAKQRNRLTLFAAAAIGVESIIFFGNGRRCPLTDQAERLGAGHGSVTDIYLPRWIAQHIFAINARLVVVATLLHAHTLVAGRSRHANR